MGSILRSSFSVKQAGKYVCLKIKKKCYDTTVPPSKYIILCVKIF